MVRIYFDTATFDDIEKDRKINMEAQLGLIGGTMGLLTGFSIISGVEIVFFIFRSILSVHSSLFRDRKSSYQPFREFLTAPLMLQAQAKLNFNTWKKEHSKINPLEPKMK